MSQLVEEPSGSASFTMRRQSPSSIATSTATSPTITQTRHRRSASDIKPTSPAARRMSMNTTPQTRSGALPSDDGYVFGVIKGVLRRPLIAVSFVMVVVVTLSTLFAVIYESALDTSLHVLPPLRSGYFAQKSNPFNQHGVKLAWLWTSLIVIPHALTAPASSSSSGSPSILSHFSRSHRLWAFLVATLCWYTFSTWFFGRGLGDRIIELSGGQCVIAIPPQWGLERALVEEFLVDLPKTAGAGAQLLESSPASHLGISSASSISTANDPLFLSVPSTLCNLRKPLNPTTNPDLFSLFASLPFPKSMYADQARPTLSIPKPRWYKGHDISGHVFILVLAILVLVRELYPSTASARLTSLATGDTQANESQVRTSAGDTGASENHVRGGSAESPANGVVNFYGIPLGWIHAIMTVSGWLLLGLWFWMLAVTSVYFHIPSEKFSGLGLGLLAGLMVDILSLTSTSPSPPGPDGDSVIASAILSSPLDEVPAKGRGLLDVRFTGSGLDENRARRGSVVDDERVIDPDAIDESSMGANSGDGKERPWFDKGNTKAE